MQVKLKHILIALSTIIVLGGAYIIFLESSFVRQTPQLLLVRKAVRFRVDSSFSPNEIKAIKESLIDWEKASNGLVKLESYVEKIPTSEIFTWRSDGIQTIYNATTLSHWPTHVMLIMGNYNNHLGLTMIYTGDIFILTGTENIFKAVVTHEVGHVIIGDYHSNNPKDLMYQTLGSDNGKIAEGDITALETALGGRE